MNKLVNLNEFIEWSKNNPQCKVEIGIGGYGKEDAGKVKTWVYDSTLGTGQFVLSVDEIDLDAAYRNRMEQKRQEVKEYFQKKEVV